MTELNLFTNDGTLVWAEDPHHPTLYDADNQSKVMELRQHGWQAVTIANPSAAEPTPKYTIYIPPTLAQEAHGLQLQGLQVTMTKAQFDDAVGPKATRRVDYYDSLVTAMQAHRANPGKQVLVRYPTHEQCQPPTPAWHGLSMFL